MNKPYQKHFNQATQMWHVTNANDKIVAVVPQKWGVKAEGVAEGIVRSLNKNKRIELPSEYES